MEKEMKEIFLVKLKDCKRKEIGSEEVDEHVQKSSINIFSSIIVICS